jgi:cyclopropane fatty-acyl-phospholipid synthase-like methyltransferase
MPTKNKKTSAPLLFTTDKHVLYEASVQAVEHEIAFMRRIFRQHRGRDLLHFREDFCGTALMSAHWVKLNPQHRAIGVDIDPEPLDWGLRHHIHKLGTAGQRLQLVNASVLDCHRPLVDAVGAYNFSYFLFKQRAQLRAYFASARKCLKKDGMLFLDAFGGLEAMQTAKDVREVTDAVDSFGRKLAPFTYEWEHAHFDVLTHDITCHIHFVLANGRRMNKAFTYHWRLWTLPEIKEILLEAGFSRAEIYTHGWDRQGEGNNNYIQRKRYENQNGWLAYLVGIA